MKEKELVSTPAAVLIGSALISLSLLVSSGVIAIKGFAPKGSQAALTGVQAPAAPAAPQGPGGAPQQPPARVDVSLGHLPAKGSSTATIGIVEFADLRCPFCKRFYDDAEKQLLSTYVNTGKAKLAFRHYEFLGPASTLAGNGAECANEQGKFWDFYDYMYKNQPSESDTSMYTSDKLTDIATGLGVNGAQFKQCLDATKFATNLNTDQTEGSTAGVTGTPAFVIGKLDPTGTKVMQGTLLVGAQPFSSFQAQIDPLLQ
jgi:protein-disulfide isomerase